MAKEEETALTAPSSSASEPVEVEAGSGTPTLEQIQELLASSVASESSLRLLPGFKMGRVGNPDFHRIYFSIHCSCGTAGLLSVEVAKSKTLPQVENALPSLKQHLIDRAKQFAGMSCEAHAQMRSGGIQASTGSPPERTSKNSAKG